VREQSIVAFSPSREGVPPLSAVRSTLIGSSFASIRGRGLEARYLTALPTDLHDAVMYTPAGTWIPVAIAEAHYAACDQMALPVSEVVEIGREVARVTQKSVLAMILRLAKEAGTTPWSLYEGCGRYWSRIFQGSGIGIFKLGPKEARFEVVSCSLARSPYWRIGLRGLLQAVSEPFATKVYVRDSTVLTSATSCGFRISWA
jgi:hypothetical protein